MKAVKFRGSPQLGKSKDQCERKLTGFLSFHFIVMSGPKRWLPLNMALGIIPHVPAF